MKTQPDTFTIASPVFPAALMNDAAVRSIATHIRAFSAYAQSFQTGDPEHDMHYRLKEKHTYGVLTHALAIAREEAVFMSDAALTRALLLAALYHDLGRFQQFKEYKTFSDAISICHADLAEQELLRLGLLRDEAEDVRTTILAAVRHHSSLAVPDSLTGLTRTVALALRDADKLDIMGIMHGHLMPGANPDSVVVLHLTDAPEVSPAILAAFEARGPVRYSDMRTTADFRLLVCAWFYDLHSDASRRAAVTSGYLHTFAKMLTESIPESMARFTADMAAYG